LGSRFSCKYPILNQKKGTKVVRVVSFEDSEIEPLMGCMAFKEFQINLTPVRFDSTWTAPLKITQQKREPAGSLFCLVHWFYLFSLLLNFSSIFGTMTL